MAISTKVGMVGQEGVIPEFVFINTTDDLATVLTTGYLNSQNNFGYTFNNSQIAFVSASDFMAMLKVNVSDTGVITLTKSIVTQ